MKALVSIVVPVYNKEKYIGKCLKSILNQSYKNIEVLTVDDGSEDSSRKIIERFVEKDSRVKLFVQQNSGVGQARNRGIQNAKGRYILFVDADDEITEDYVATLMKYHSYDLVVSGIKMMTANGNEETQSIILQKSTQFLPQNLEVILSHDNYPIFAIVCTKLFDLSIIKKFGLKFLSLQYGEDSIFMLNYLSKINSVKIIPYVGYLNNIISGTLSHGRRDNIWQQAKVIPQKAKEYFNLKANSKMFQFLTLRSVKLSFMNSTINYQLFRNTYDLIEKDDIPQLLNIAEFDRRIDKILTAVIKNHLVFLLYIMFKLQN